MAKYTITAERIIEETIVVEAESELDAIDEFHNGNGTVIDGHEFTPYILHIDEDESYD